MLVSYVFRSIIVCIEGVATGAALEEGLGAAISTMLIATFRARLAGMPGIDSLDSDTALLRLVDREIVQLRKRPCVQPTFGIVLLALANLRAFPNIGQVLKDNCSSSRSILNKALC